VSSLRIISPRPSDRVEGRFEPHVTSETGTLDQVIVHTPGVEVELVSPENRLDLLFEDILFVGHARKEHLLMCALFEKIVGRPDAVLQITTLLREALLQESARFDFVEQLCVVGRHINLQAFEGRLKELAPDELQYFALTGQSRLPISVPPVPNLMFTRDVAAIVGDTIILSHPATAARARESVIANVVFRHHPGFADCRERVVTLPAGVTFEGGDLILASPHVALIGQSERTSVGGALAVAQALFDRTSVEHVLMVDLPKTRSYMHLDTVLTFCSPDECVVYPPLIEGRDRGNVVHLTRGELTDRFVSAVRPSLKQALEELLGRSLTFIPCGGDEPLNQAREQWTDGANFFALAPGLVAGYERNHRTFEMMQRHDYRVVTVRGFLSYYEESDYHPGEKVAVKLEGTELSRGRGGPRCMALPISRYSDRSGGDGSAAA
jgi:arginine deiminase